MTAVRIVFWIGLLGLLVATVANGAVPVQTGLFIAAVAVVGGVAYAGRRAASRKARQWMHRYDNGLCLHCGYDKRSDPRGRCPECGRF
ncbi:MAG TPA: hypothetical protein VF796_05115 [Humisphaera sp.]